MESRHITSSENKSNDKPRTCYFCNAEEGQIRKIGQFEVSLRTVTYEGELNLACQSCARKAIKSSYPQQQNAENNPSGIKKVIASFSSIGFLLLLLTVNASAQLPGFPDAPSQAPIDGGLGLLAATGGAYALNKLRNRKTN